MKKRKTKRKWVAADEGFDFGPLRLMRLGRLVVLQNRSTEEQHEAYMARLANLHPGVCRQIDELVSRIAETVARFKPLPLLHHAYWEYLPHSVGIASEIEAGDETNLSRLTLEYLQSMICAVPPADTQKDQPTDKEWSSLVQDIRDLYQKLRGEYFLTKSAWAQQNDPQFDKEREEFSVFAQMLWIAVRGDRYLVHDVPHFQDLLSPHNDELSKLFGFTTEDLLEGLNCIVRNFTRGPMEAFDELDRFRTVTLDEVERLIQETDADGDPADLMDQVLQKHGWQEWRDRVLGESIGYSLFDMGTATNWPPNLLDCLSWGPGEAKDFLSAGSFRGWPLKVLPTWKKPFLKIDGRHYCFGLYNLTDHGYRIFQGAILALDPGYREIWNRRQQEVSENLPFTLLGRLLPGATTYHSIYYRWLTGKKNKRQWCETDGLLIYDDHLIIIEVKAGAFTHTPPSTDFPAYIASMDQLLRAPSDQTRRFCDYLESRPTVIIYDAGHQPIAQLQRENFRHITRCCITLDQLTDLAARSEHLKNLGVDIGQEPVWTVSVDDLRVFADVFDNPLIFCHFLEERARAFRSPAVDIKDELDHLGLYLSHNSYSLHAEEFEFETPLNWTGYRQNIDRFFWSKITGEDEPLPAQPLPMRLKEILDVLSESDTLGLCKAAAWIMDMDGDLREKAEAMIEQIFDEQNRSGRPKPITIGSGVAATFYCSIAGTVTHLPKTVRFHTLATLQQAGEQERLALELFYSADHVLQRVQPSFFTPDDIRANEMEELAAYTERMVTQRFQRHFAQTGKRKIGRNKPCPCGSGKKYKKCCGSQLVRR